MRLQHVTIAAPRDGAAQAREFYGGLLGLEERDVLPKLDASSIIWFRVGEPDLELHVVLGDAPAEGRHHLCLEVDDLPAVRARLDAAGVATNDATEIIGRPRFFCHDPFGNLVELAHIE
jgi:catechol 2,3-dioxygenase-like lactoylglutathione lyase family enzyme